MSIEIYQLLKQEHSKKQTERIVNYIGNDKARFALLAELFFSGEYRITQRAAWPLSYCVRAHPGLIRPYFKRLLDNLRRKDVHVAVIRNTVRLLQDVDIPRRYHGQVMSTCFELIQTVETPVAVKAFSLTILAHLAAGYPDIGNELKLIIDEQWEHATPAFKVRARAALKAINGRIPAARK